MSPGPLPTLITRFCKLDVWLWSWTRTEFWLYFEKIVLFQSEGSVWEGHWRGNAFTFGNLMWERCYKPGAVPGPLLEFSFHNHIKVRNRFCPGRIVHQGVTDTDTLMAGHWHAAPGLWSHPCHGSSDLGKVRSVDTWHSPGVLGLVSGLSSLSLIGWWRSSLINTLLSITNTHSCHPQLSLNIDTRFTFPGSWNSSVLLQVMFVAIEWVEPRNLNSLPGPLSMPTLSSQSNLMLLSILMILPMPICGPVIRIKTCSEMYWNYSRYVKNRGLEV